MDFNVQITGVTQLVASFRDAPTIVTPILQKALSAAQALLAKYTTKGVVPWRTGFLTQSFRAEIDQLTLRWFPTADYASFVEFGHRQTPGRFVPAIGKRLVASKVAGNPFMERIIGAAQNDINDMFGQALKQITEALAAQTS